MRFNIIIIEWLRWNVDSQSAHLESSEQSTVIVPVLWDIDVGHIPPRMTFVNGAIAEVIYDGQGKGCIEFFLE